MTDINIYITFESWYKERPDATISGTIMNQKDNIIEIVDNEGFTQIINIDKCFAITHKREGYLG